MDGGNGLGTYTYSYTSSGNASGANSWSQKTIETTPNGTQNIVYTNAYGDVIVSATVVGGSQWVNDYQYDGNQDRVVAAAMPSAVSTSGSGTPVLTDPNGSSYYVSGSSGLITDYSYAGATGGGNVQGYLQSTSLANGSGGTPVTQESWTYSPDSGNGVTIYQVATDVVYRNIDGSGSQTTQYNYTYYSGTDAIDMITTILPTVTSGENPVNGGMSSSTDVYNLQGELIWTRDGGGYLTYMTYDAATGAMDGEIDDVNTNEDEDGGDDLPGEASTLPGGWSTPAEGGANEITTDEIDFLGRVVETTDPQDRATFTIFDDIHHATRTYTGWSDDGDGSYSLTANPMPPTQVEIDNWGSGQTVNLTMSERPHLTNLVPDGSESISELQSLSVSKTNSAGQDVEDDAYYNLVGVSVSTAGGVSGGSVYVSPTSGNYYATVTGYDADGQEARDVSPAGTITRTVYDGLDRKVGVYVGTVDGQGWSPSSPGNLVQTESDVYDFGGVGDGNLTQQTMYSGTASEPNSITLYAYDWRDRQVGEKDGAAANINQEGDGTDRPITITTYDNLNEVTQTQTYDGDGLALTNGAGALQVPSPSLLTSQSGMAYDERGQEYQSTVTSVAVGTGLLGATLTSNLFYDSRGNLVQSQPAGGVVTVNMYNGLGEEFESVDEASPGGTELTETDNDYDADEELDEQVITRFGLGVVPNQVDYSGVYRDSAGREVAMVDVGNNGGSVWSMPASPPARSSTALVTTFGYNEQDEQVQSVDPNGLVTTSTFDALGQALSSVADASGSANGSDGSGAQNKTTVMTYGPAGELSLTAVNGSVSQTTGYGYGVRVGQGDTINSNDLLAVTEYPDPTTGLASTARNETVVDEYDDEGQVLTSTDRNGDVHAYSYDSLGRETLDAVTTLGAGVDGTVRAIGTSYNDQGNVWFTTSYSSPTPGNGAIVNQFQDVYDGFGQVVQEYQAVNGGVVVGSTPSVQYTYAEGGSDSDRLTGMVYPDGYTVNSVYDSGTDSDVSRVSALTDSSGTVLEGYTYLGDGEVLGRTDQVQSQLETLDQFGRVSGVTWMAGGMTSSSYTYRYDDDGNVLSKVDNVTAGLSQTYQYDGLNQVTSYLESSGPAGSQGYTYDVLGNRLGVTTNGSSSGMWGANAQNEITSVGSSGSAPIYDADGNMTADQTGLVYTYDAWNRLVKVSSSAGTLETMSYDGQSRLVVDTNAGIPTNRYYSLADQVLEEQSGGVYTARYVWSEVYVNALVFRDTNASGLSATSSYTRVWAQQDANFNVMALVNASGAVVARFDYTAFGVLITVSGGVTNWVYGFQGMRLDSVTGWVESESRWYSPSLGSWTSVDPLGFGGGDVREYGMEKNSVINDLDATGLADADTSGAKAAIRNEITAIWKGSDADLETALKEVDRLIDDAQFVWNHQAGYIGECDRWVSEYYSIVKPRVLELRKKRYLHFCTRVEEYSVRYRSLWP